ncbi:MAG: ABC transporter permease [Pseudomonadota bacterium]
MLRASFYELLEAVVLTTAAFAMTLILFGAFVAYFGHNPLDVYYVLYLGSFARSISIENTLTQAAPLMLTALCTAIPARAGLLVIGGEGALVVGGIATVLVGVHLAGFPFALGILIMMLAGALAGGLWIGAAGALRQYRGVNETISTLLLNYIAIAILNHLISGPIRDYDQVLRTASWSIPETLMVGVLPGFDVHWGLVVGIVLCLLLYVSMRQTTFGFGVDILGGNERAAQLAGLPINRMVLICCFIGGAAAGLAGTMEVVAVHGFASDSLVVGFGYAGILIAFLARHNPMAIILVAILLGGISASGGLLQRRFDLPDATTAVLQGILFMMVLASNTAYGRLHFLRPKGI